MNEFDPHRPGEHEEVALLLPWYVNQSLEDGERARVRAHLRHCLVCHREVLALRSLSTTLAGMPTLDLGRQAAFARLEGRLPPRPARRGFRLSRPALAAAASLLLAVALAGWRFQAPQPADFYTLASPRAVPERGEIRLVFAKELTRERIDALLNGVGGRIVAGPNALGAFAIQLDGPGRPTDPAAALAFLRRQEGVVLAEPMAAGE